MKAVMRNPAAAAAHARAAGGFVDLYERTVRDVYSYLMSRLHDREVAEELTQDVFVVGARRVAAGEVVDVAWLIGVARHKLVDHWRIVERENRNLALAGSSELTRRGGDPASIAPGVATAVLARLNETYRAALVLRHVDGLSVAAVADHLDRSVEATEQILTRARAAFRDRYRGASDD
jgi:RNA polymerase sigma-70 factor (ECF subfamily)